MVAQSHSLLVRKVHGIAGRRTLSAEKWRPVIIEIAKMCGGIEGPYIDFA